MQLMFYVTLSWVIQIGVSNNLAFDLEVGDNFAMRAKGRNAKGADFYILNV